VGPEVEVQPAIRAKALPAATAVTRPQQLWIKEITSNRIKATPILRFRYRRHRICVNYRGQKRWVQM
jgi:hypothetical protein